MHLHCYTTCSTKFFDFALILLDEQDSCVSTICMIIAEWWLVTESIIHDWLSDTWKVDHFAMFLLCLLMWLNWIYLAVCCWDFMFYHLSKRSCHKYAFGETKEGKRFYNLDWTGELLAHSCEERNEMRCIASQMVILESWFHQQLKYIPACKNIFWVDF